MSSSSLRVLCSCSCTEVAVAAAVVVWEDNQFVKWFGRQKCKGSTQWIVVKWFLFGFALFIQMREPFFLLAPTSNKIAVRCFVSTQLSNTETSECSWLFDKTFSLKVQLQLISVSFLWFVANYLCLFRRHRNRNHTLQQVQSLSHCVGGWHIKFDQSIYPIDCNVRTL